jgi:arylamine N-acetyltransferase
MIKIIRFDGVFKDEDYYEQPFRRPVQHQPPVLMRTGRNQENTSLNVRARQRNDEGGSYARRISPRQQAPSSYGRTQYQYANNQSNSMRPTAIARPPVSTTIRCGDCGSIFNNNLARYCPQCGSRR